ncbi:MAG: hypothetical protein FVQ77_06855 [Cytophagales bacterium]|nr:hypothetical protein [Cytophagales bacterium]
METLKTFNSNCAKNIVITFISTLLWSSYLFAQGPVKYPSTNGSKMSANEILELGGALQVNVLLIPDTSGVGHGNPPKYYMVFADDQGRFYRGPERRLPGGKPAGVGGGGPALTAPCLAIKGRQHGNNINLCDEATTNLGIGTTENTFPTGVRFAVIGDSRFIGTIKIVSGTQVMLLDGNEIDANGTLFLNNNSNNDVVLANGGGNVMIGGTIPYDGITKFSVYDALYPSIAISNGAQSLQLASVTTNGFWSNISTVGDAVIRANGFSEDLILTVRNPNNGAIRFTTSGSTFNDVQRMAILGDGKVIIGTKQKINDFADALLHVYGGKIVCSDEVVVMTTGWNDYVLAPGYPLPDLLSKVKPDIFKDHSLDGIPTTEEVVSKGIHLGDISKALVKKVEEIFLYLIEIKEEIKAMMNDIFALKNNDVKMQEEINQLKEKNEMLEQENVEMKRDIMEMKEILNGLKKK